MFVLSPIVCRRVRRPFGPDSATGRPRRRHRRHPRSSEEGMATALEWRRRRRCAAGSCGGQLLLGHPPTICNPTGALLNTIAALTVWFAQMLVLPVPVAYAVIWCVETAKGQCSRLVGAVAVALAAAGAVAAFIGVGQALPATSWWLSSSLSALVNDHTPALSADISADLRSARPWLYVAAVVSLAIVCAPPHARPSPWASELPDGQRRSVPPGRRLRKLRDRRSRPRRSCARLRRRSVTMSGRVATGGA